MAIRANSALYEIIFQTYALALSNCPIKLIFAVLFKLYICIVHIIVVSCVRSTWEVK